MKRLALFSSCLLAAACARRETVETWPAGQPKRVHEYSPFGPRDSLHLRGSVSYFLNGNPEEEARFRNGRLHGEYRAFWQNGQLQARGRYVDGWREGSWEFFHNRFTPAARGEYRRGAKTGLWTDYWENGELKRRGEYREGRETGEWTEWNPRGGEILRSSCFEANPRGHYRSFHEGGALREECDCRRGRKAGPFAENHPDGTPKTRGFYDTSGVKDSLWELFHANGHKASREIFRAGVWNDSVLRWDDSGRVAARGFFHMGTGTLTRFDSAGGVLERRPMIAGRDHGENRTYYPGGGRRQVLAFDRGRPLSYRRWHRNGALAAAGDFKDGKRTGVWKEWGERGRLRESAEYENGEWHGERRFYDSAGALTRVQRYFRGLPTKGYFPNIPGARD